MKVHGDSIKSKPNCLCYINIMLDDIILKLSRCLENSTNNMISAHRNILFNRLKDVSAGTLSSKFSSYEVSFRFCDKVGYAYVLHEIIVNKF